MRRSLLFIPGNNPAMLQNADIFESDAIIIDLEDAVSINDKDSARNLVYYFLEQTNDFPSEIVIRINGLDTNYYKDDLLKIATDKIDTIMLPKARKNTVLELGEILSEIEKTKKMKKTIGIIPIIESPLAVLEMEEIARSPRVNGLLLGAEDLTSEMSVERTFIGNEILYPRIKMGYLCKALEIDAIDTPFTDTQNEEGLRQDAINAKSFALNAKSCIHPNQIEIINEIFSPSKKQIDWAKKVMLASNSDENKNLGVFSLDGKMVDKPIIERAKKILLLADKFNLE